MSDPLPTGVQHMLDALVLETREESERTGLSPALHQLADAAYRIGRAAHAKELSAAGTGVRTELRTDALRAIGMCGAVSGDAACIMPLGHGPHGFDVLLECPYCSTRTLMNVQGECMKCGRRPPGTSTQYAPIAERNDLKSDPVLVALVDVMASAEQPMQWPDKEVVDRAAMDRLRLAISNAHERENAPGMDRA